jgi:hypothetical protein
MAIGNPRQIAAQHIDSKCGSHQDCAYPEAPVMMHTTPVRPWVWFASAAAVSFGIVPVSSHYFSISDEHSPLSADAFQRGSNRTRLLWSIEAGLATNPAP